MHNPRRIFLDWDRPALDRAVEYLTQDWEAGPLDLRSTLILVPTRHAGRRLREKLAVIAADRGTGVLLGRVEIAPTVFQPRASVAPVATGVAAELFWRRALPLATAEQRAAIGHASMSTDLAARMASHFVLLRDLLCEEGYDLAGFAEHYARQAALLGSDELTESSRWQALAELEASYRQLLERAGWADDVAIKLAMADRPDVGAGIRRVVLLFVPDPPLLALRGLARFPKEVRVEVCIHAPASAADQFDEWGRPRPEAWAARQLAIDPSRVEVCDDAISIAERIGQIVSAANTSQRAGMAIGVGDTQSVSRIHSALARSGVPAFDPSGRGLACLPIHGLLSRLLRLSRDRRAANLLPLLRHPYLLQRLQRQAPASIVLLELFDQFQRFSLPDTLETAIELAKQYGPDRATPEQTHGFRVALSDALHLVADWLKRLAAGSLCETSAQVLADILRDADPDEGALDEINALRRVLTDFARIEALCVDVQEAQDFLIHLLEVNEIPVRRGAGQIDLLGWLELAWEDAPVLLLTDLNEGLIPQAITADPFLPDHARAALGLRDNRQRHARDAYLLETLIRCRPADHFRGFMARRGSRGDLLKPSRLLLQTDPGQLARRALYLFAEGAASTGLYERNPGWRLTGPALDQFSGTNRLSVSALKTYLQCPFRFYLQQLVRMGDPIEELHELDAGGFGTVIHEAFEYFAKSPSFDSADSSVIERVLYAGLDRALGRRFAGMRTLPLTIQEDVIRQRLSYAARIQAAWRGQGWVIDPAFIEHKAEIHVGTDVVSARIDRIDRHATSGAICVMDYKTGHRAGDPAKSHLKSIGRADDGLWSFAYTPDERKRWADLQLPMYAAACRSLFPDSRGDVHAAYFLLPSAVTDTAVAVFEGLNDELVDSARTCAASIFRRVRAGVFWPPIDDCGDRDALEPVFMGDVVANLAPAFRAELERRAAAFDGGAG